MFNIEEAELTIDNAIILLYRAGGMFYFINFDNTVV
jgi:hypothetical protein